MTRLRVQSLTTMSRPFAIRLIAGILAAYGLGTGTSRDHYAMAQQALPQGLVGWWKFDETAGTTARDSSGNGFDASLEARVSFQPGKTGHALYSGGKSEGASFIYAPGSKIDFTAASRPSILFWVKIAALPNNVRLMGAFDTGGMGVEIGAANNGKIDFITFSGSPNTSWPEAVSADDTWHHYAITADGTNVHLYRDGALVGTNAFVPNWTSTGGKKFFLGGDAAYSLSGHLDDVRIYDRVLSASDIEAVYNATK